MNNMNWKPLIKTIGILIGWAVSTVVVMLGAKYVGQSLDEISVTVFAWWLFTVIPITGVILMGLK